MLSRTEIRDTIIKSHENGFNVRDEFKNMTEEEIRNFYIQHTSPFRVCAFNVEGDLNIGMMIRTASLFGAEKFYIFGRRKIDNRSLVGAQKYIPVEKINGLDENGNFDISLFETFCDNENICPVLLETGGTVLTLFDWEPYVGGNKRLCLVFGNEASGLPDTLRARNYPTVSIPQMGVLRSFNVAAAAGIVMWDMMIRGMLLPLEVSCGI